MRIWRAGKRPRNETELSIDRPLNMEPAAGKYLVIGREPFYIENVSYSEKKTIVDSKINGTPHRFILNPE